MTQQFNVFVYGTLLRQNMVESMLRRKVEFEDAELLGYEKRKISALYMVFPKAGATVKGKLMTNLRPQDMVTLDHYESVGNDWYERNDVLVRNEAGKIQRVITYAAGDRALRNNPGEVVE